MGEASEQGFENWGSRSGGGGGLGGVNDFIRGECVRDEEQDGASVGLQGTTQVEQDRPARQKEPAE